MGMLAWVMMGLALWHFTIWLPDRFWGGIVGAFVGALIGAVLFGLIVNGFHIPGRHDTHLSTALEAIPGALIGMALVYFEGVRRERGERSDGHRAHLSTIACRAVARRPPRSVYVAVAVRVRELASRSNRLPGPVSFSLT